MEFTLDEVDTLWKYLEIFHKFLLRLALSNRAVFDPSTVIDAYETLQQSEK